MSQIFEQLPTDILDTLDTYMHQGLDRTEPFEVAPGFKITFRSLSGEEEIDSRNVAGEFRGPAYIYTYKTKVLSYVICGINNLTFEPGQTIKVPRDRTNSDGVTETVLTDVLLSSVLEGKILSWSRSLIDICFKLWSKHQEDQLYNYILPHKDADLFTVEERMMAKEYERLLGENSQATSELTPQEMVLAAQNTTPATDMVKLGARAVKQADPHIDFNEE